ncbi:MAG: cyanophycin synthetase [Phycisphaerales bacterium]
MEIQRTRALRGPNRWTQRTVIEALVHCPDTGRSLVDLPGFESRLREVFPDVGVLPSPRTGSMSLAHALEAVALALQEQAGCPVTFSHTEPTDEPGTNFVVVEYSEEEVGRRALEEARALLEAVLAPEPFDLERAVGALRAIDEDVRLGPSTGSIVTAVVARNIPFRRLTQGSLVQFGWGRRARRIQAAETDVTSVVSEAIAQDKDLTKAMLHAAGVPVPLGRPVGSLEEAWVVAQEVGLPVVVKPVDGNQGKGVTVNVDRREVMEVAYRAASEIGPVLVERCLPGNDFRMLVVGDRLVAAARRDPPFVTGDGLHTVRELVAKVNEDPRRGEGHATTLTKIRLDEIACTRLQLQGLAPDSVPERGRRVVLRNNANLSTGGTATDVTDDVHPEVAERAVAAAQIVGLHVCGVDVVCESLMRPLEEQGGGVVEVNAAPGLRMHLAPSHGRGRNVGEAIVGMLFPPGDDGRIPVVAVTGTNGKTTTVRMIAHLFEASGKCVGFTGTDGIHVGGRLIERGDCSGPRSARSVLMHPDVDAAVFETARGGILREGLGFDRCQVAVVTNLGEGDHLGIGHVNTVEQLAAVKGVIVQALAPTGAAVLNATDPHVASMERLCPGDVIFFASTRPHPVIERHRARGKRCVFVDGPDIVAVHGAQQQRLALQDIPMTASGTIPFQVENAMASIAAAWACGIDWEVIRRGLASFRTDHASVPGRFNRLEFRGATVIMDYGHNPDAMRALVRAVEAMPSAAEGRRSVVISAAGDRRDRDITAQTAILGSAFDDVVLYEDACQRGRGEGEVMGLLRSGLEGAARTTRIDEIRGEFLAIDTALDRLRPGDLCLVLVDQVEQALAHIVSRVTSSKADGAGNVA